jgi:hypothetical protein
LVAAVKMSRPWAGHTANIGFAAIGAYQNIFSTPERYSALVTG